MSLAEEFGLGSSVIFTTSGSTLTVKTSAGAASWAGLLVSMAPPPPLVLSGHAESLTPY
jgi:hypothetical protein